MLSETVPVYFADNSQREEYGRGQIKSYTQVMSTDEEGQPQIIWLFMVAWENIRTPALMFHSAEELTNDIDFDELEFHDDDDDEPEAITPEVVNLNQA